MGCCAKMAEALGKNVSPRASVLSVACGLRLRLFYVEFQFFLFNRHHYVVAGLQGTA